MPTTWKLSPRVRANKITRYEVELVKLEAEIERMTKEQEILKTARRDLQKRRIAVMKQRDQLKDPAEDWRLRPTPTFDDVN